MRRFVALIAAVAVLLAGTVVAAQDPTDPTDQRILELVAEQRAALDEIERLVLERSPDPEPEPTTTTTVAPEPEPEPTTTTAPPPTTEPPAPEPEPTSWPDAETTGPTGTLTPSGSIVVSQDGAVIENLHVTGTIEVKAHNVTIRNVHVDVRALYGIKTYPGFRGLVVEDTSVDGPGSCNVGILPNQYTARRVEVKGCQDGLRVGNNTLIEDSWIHSQVYTDGAHNDAVQSLGGTGIVMRGNRLDGPYKQQTSAIIFHSNLEPLRDVLFERNRFAGGTYTVYIRAKSGKPLPENVRFVDNVWERCSWKFGSHVFEGDTELVSGNTYDDGSPYGYQTTADC